MDVRARRLPSRALYSGGIPYILRDRSEVSKLPPFDPGLSRRDLLKSLSVLAAGLPSLRAAALEPKIPERRLELLDEMERRACRYFWECASPSTGLVLDRARTSGPDSRRIASIAATGFGLSALCIADAREFIPETAVLRRALRTLEFLARRTERHRGFFYHFVDINTGQRAGTSEVSSVDMAWLLCGVIFARQYFENRQIRELANDILAAVEWDWLWDGGPALRHGWTPESGFLPYRWDSYSELLAMYLLAIASPTHPIPSHAWTAWHRPRRETAPGKQFIESRAPLFVHQYSQAWLDFRGLRDGNVDYFQNSRFATTLHREFCIGLHDRFPWFGEDMWGITASDSRYGYIDWGGPDSAANAKIDGTLVPCAAGGSLVFLPEECSVVLQTMIERYGNRVWTRYGFVDAFHPAANWWSPDVLGIDLGIMMMMAENYRCQSVWQAMMAAPEVRRGLEAARFAKVSSPRMLARE